MSGHRRQRREDVREKGAGNGLNLNNIDLTSIAGLLNNIDLNQITGLINNLSQNNRTGDSNVANGSNRDDNESKARRSEIVKAINTLLNSDRSEVLQVLLQVYAANRSNPK